MSDAAPIWRPAAAAIEGSELTRYQHWLAATHGRTFAEYEALWEWSTTDLEGFWGSLWEYFDITASVPYERVLGNRTMPGAEWFPGARLSYAEHIFRGKRDDDVAIVHASETRPLAELRWGELRDLTARIAAGLRAHGVTRGDRVVAYMPNIPETTAAFLACASIGAVWSSC
jgi:acetoacetyl-CoA synthetase